jgi:hypothetical protein
MRSLSSLFAVVLLAAIATATAGCASTGPTTTDRSDVIGVWEYRTNGTPYLDRGRFQIVLTRNGRLDGRLRDSRLGTVELDDVRLQNGHMHLRIEVQSAYSAQTSTLQISGRVEDDRYTATFRRPIFDVTTSQNTSRTASSTSGGSILARRVRTSTVHDMPVPLGCTGILVEHNYHCR